MNIVIAGAGQVGRHAAEVLGGAGHRVTVIDTSARVLRTLDETVELKSFQGNCAQAEKLREAGVAGCDLFIAATSDDETNLFSASVAKGVGAKQCLARVHHSTYFAQRGLDYKQHFGIDELLCPEFITAQSIARALRNPGASTIENFADGAIQMQKFPVNPDAPAVGQPLPALPLPARVRAVELPPHTLVAAIQRTDGATVPGADDVVEPGQTLLVVGAHGIDKELAKVFVAR